jgi:uncharacterized membrane-anchored protein YhcB (DUF1043 family)
MLRVWIVIGIVLLIGVALGLWLAARARRNEAQERRRSSAPDDDIDFLRGLDPDGRK